jgi:integrase
MHDHEITEHTPEIGTSLVEYCRDVLHVCPSRVTRANGIVSKLNRLYFGLDGNDALWGKKSEAIILSEEFQQMLYGYKLYCQKKGNKESTIKNRIWICSRFLKNLEALGCSRSSDLTSDLIQKAFLHLQHMHYWDRIGPFLAYLFETNQLTHDYSKLIQYRKKRIIQPTVYTVGEISELEQSVDLTTPAGIRNKAILLLMTRYGIRSRDIASLTFEDVDFDNNRIHFVQKKTGNPWEMELLPEVKRALLEYIQHNRPEVPECSRIFLTAQIPYKPIDYLVIDTAIWTLFAKSDVNTEGKRHGGRSLRSSLASNMVNSDVSTEIVRRVLGHGTKYAIRHYARLDIESMRICALCPPVPSGNFAKALVWKGADRDV